VITRFRPLTHLGELWLDDWLERNALICWQPRDEAVGARGGNYQEGFCPLNIKDNEHHPFFLTLRKIRADALANARLIAVANEDNQARRRRASSTR
jgi:hypothetical protein